MARRVRPLRNDVVTAGREKARKRPGRARVEGGCLAHSVENPRREIEGQQSLEAIAGASANRLDTGTLPAWSLNPSALLLWPCPQPRE